MTQAARDTGPPLCVKKVAQPLFLSEGPSFG